jgi:hypothetical protein
MADRAAATNYRRAPPLIVQNSDYVVAYAERREMTFAYQIDSREQAMLAAARYSSPAMRAIDALEADGYRLARRDGDQYEFVKDGTRRRALKKPDGRLLWTGSPLFLQ